MKSAYKQLALAPEDVCKGGVSILEPGDGGEVKCFLMRTLPFGAKAAVYHFNRVARFIWAIGCYLHVPWANYIDDYPVISHQAMEASTMSAVKAMLRLIGFVLSEDKLGPFTSNVEMLGVQLDLSEPSEVRIRNKLSRQVEIASAIDEVLDAGCMEQRALPSILGKI